MTHRSIFAYTATIALAAAALAAPTALARPADMPPSDAKATAAAQHKQNGRPHDTNVGAYTPGAIPAVTYPSGATAVDSATRPSVPGPPTWPVNPQPINPVRAIHVSDTGGGLDWTTIALGIAGLLTIGGIGTLARRNRRMQRARVIA
jgi:hypothetical protein